MTRSAGAAATIRMGSASLSRSRRGSSATRLRSPSARGTRRAPVSCTAASSRPLWTGPAVSSRPGTAFRPSPSACSCAIASRSRSTASSRSPPGSPAAEGDACTSMPSSATRRRVNCSPRPEAPSSTSPSSTSWSRPKDALRARRGVDGFTRARTEATRARCRRRAHGALRGLLQAREPALRPLREAGGARDRRPLLSRLRLPRPPGVDDQRRAVERRVRPPRLRPDRASNAARPGLVAAGRDSIAESEAAAMGRRRFVLGAKLMSPAQEERIPPRSYRHGRADLEPLRERHDDVADVEAERGGQADPLFDLVSHAVAIAAQHQAADPGALGRTPEHVLDEDREHPVRTADELLLRLLRGALEEDALVGQARAVMDAVVDREAVAKVLEHRPARRAGDQAEPGDDEALEEDLHEEDLLLQRVEVQLEVGELVEVGVALARPPRRLGQAQPGLDVARLVLRHRRVVELRLVMGSELEQLRRHLDRERVGLELLGDDGAPDALAARPLLVGAPRLRDRRLLLPREIAHLPLVALGEPVVAEDAVPALRARLLPLRRRSRLAAHRPQLTKSIRRVSGAMAQPSPNGLPGGRGVEAGSRTAYTRLPPGCRTKRIRPHVR